MKALLGWARNRRGVTMMEYALIAALLSIVVILAMVSTGGAIDNKFAEVSNNLK